MSTSAARRGRGFTLIEVLVALAIVAFGLSAVFGQLGQSATAAGRLRDKTLAHWVAMNVLTEMRLRGDFPAAGTRSDNVEMARVRWHYEVRVEETASDALRRADITVGFEDDPGRPLATAVGFLPQPVTGGVPRPTSGWPLVTPGAGPVPGGDPPPGNAPQPRPAPAPDTGSARQ